MCSRKKKEVSSHCLPDTMKIEHSHLGALPVVPEKVVTDNQSKENQFIYSRVSLCRHLKTKTG